MFSASAIMFKPFLPMVKFLVSKVADSSMIPIVSPADAAAGRVKVKAAAEVLQRYPFFFTAGAGSALITVHVIPPPAAAALTALLSAVEA